MKKIVSILLCFLLIFSAVAVPGLFSATAHADDYYFAAAIRNGVLVFDPYQGEFQSYLVTLYPQNQPKLKFVQKTFKKDVAAITVESLFLGYQSDTYDIVLQILNSNSTPVAESERFSYVYTNSRSTFSNVSVSIEKPVEGVYLPEDPAITVSLDHGSAEVSGIHYYSKKTSETQYNRIEANGYNKFLSGYQYRVQIYFTLDSNTVMMHDSKDSDYTASVNGGTAVFKNGNSSGYSPTIFSVTYDFPSILKQPSGNVKVTAPDTGVEPVFQASLENAVGFSVYNMNSNIYRNGVAWYEDVEKQYLLPTDSYAFFRSGNSHYMAKIYLMAKDGYGFSRTAGGITINGEYANVEYISEDKVIVYRFFDMPVYQVSLSVSPPDTGSTPDFSPSMSTSLTSFIPSGNSTSWYDATAGKAMAKTDVFKDGHQYRITVRVNPKVFNYYHDSCTYWINGKSANVAAGNSGYADLEVYFNDLARPKLKSVINDLNGPTVSWQALESTENYGVYRKAEGETGFKKIGTTTGLSFTDKTAVSGKTYRYSVRALSRDGSQNESQLAASLEIRYLAAPVIQKAENALTGVKVSWSKVSSASKYIVYRKGPGETSFKRIDATASTSYTDTKVDPNTQYRYSVRAITSDGKTLSGYSAGMSFRYIAAPVIKAENALEGVRISWNSVAGASKYYIYRKGPGESGFSLLASTTNLTYTNKGVTSGNDYRYSVRAVPANGSMSAFSAGQTVSYLKAPTISVENTSSGIKISWAKIPGAAKYYVYRKGPGETGFTKLAGAVGTTLTDKTAVAGKEYRYSVRSVNSDATVMSAFSAGKTITCRK